MTEVDPVGTASGGTPAIEDEVNIGSFVGIGTGVDEAVNEEAVG
jgi:hypothetical protein